VDLSALDEIVPPVAAAIAATRDAESLRRAHERLVQIRDEERQRLRDDLHDELSPALSGLRLAASAAAASLEAGDPETAAGLLARMEFESGRASGVIHGILEDLRPDELDGTDLVQAVRNRVMTFDRPGRFAVHVEAEDPLPPVTAGVELATYRAASEAVANAARHSGGTQCWVRLSGQSGGLLLEVTDDGVGINPGPSVGGVGLGSMAGRVDAVGGVLSVSPSNEGGTSVRAVFPAASVATVPSAVPGDSPMPSPTGKSAAAVR
jgi:signal transduction histidine kinase